jgi:hypothetical protein
VFNERHQLLEHGLAEREAAKAARRLRPLSADAQATRDKWARWRAERAHATIASGPRAACYVGSGWSPGRQGPRHPPGVGRRPGFV